MHFALHDEFHEPGGYRLRQRHLLLLVGVALEAARCGRMSPSPAVRAEEDLVVLDPAVLHVLAGPVDDRADLQRRAEIDHQRVRIARRIGLPTRVPIGGRIAVNRLLRLALALLETRAGNDAPAAVVGATRRRACGWPLARRRRKPAKFGRWLSRPTGNRRKT